MNAKRKTPSRRNSTANTGILIQFGTLASQVKDPPNRTPIASAIVILGRGCCLLSRHSRINT